MHPLKRWCGACLVSLTILAACSSTAPSSSDSEPVTSTPAVDATAEVTSIPPTSEPDSAEAIDLRAFQSSVEIAGSEEVVYDYATDRCGPNDAPDLPIHPFRDADGLIQINISNPMNRRMTGQDLDSVRMDCENVTLASDYDSDPSHFNFEEWMGSTYTLDGHTVYALIHNEFHGHEASKWQASWGFGGEQGGFGWEYRDWDGSSYQNMVFDEQNDRWQGRRSLCSISSGWVHPDVGCSPTRSWISPTSDTVTVSGSASRAQAEGGDGVVVTILKGDEELWSETIEAGDSGEQRFDVAVPVLEGDAINFRVDHRGDASFDATNFDPRINLEADPCPSGVRMQCQTVSLTHAVSTDGGKLFTQPPAPDHLVATLPYRYEPDGGLLANWQPSNIVKSPHNGYFYVLVELDINRPGTSWYQGSCVMRTKTLDDPKSWRAWDGEGFNMRFINPYGQTDQSNDQVAPIDPNDHICQIVPVNRTGALTYNLTYNTYFEMFLAVGIDSNNPVTGFYYALSEDLINWTPAELLFAGNLDVGEPFIAYPSLVDPDNATLNFDVTGQTPYLYFSRFQRASLQDVNLVRVRVRFDKE